MCIQYRLLVDVNQSSAGCGLLSSALAACRPVPHWHWVIIVHAISQPPCSSETRFLLNHPVFPHASRWLRGLIVMFNEANWTLIYPDDRVRVCQVGISASD